MKQVFGRNDGVTRIVEMQPRTRRGPSEAADHPTMFRRVVVEPALALALARRLEPALLKRHRQNCEGKYRRERNVAARYSVFHCA